MIDKEVGTQPELARTLSLEPDLRMCLSGFVVFANHVFILATNVTARPYRQVTWDRVLDWVAPSIHTKVPHFLCRPYLTTPCSSRSQSLGSGRGTLAATFAIRPTFLARLLPLHLQNVAGAPARWSPHMHCACPSRLFR